MIEETDNNNITTKFHDLLISGTEDIDAPESDSESQRKLFVGGLSWQTSEDALKEYFESLDIDVEKVIIMRDKVTGRSRGFGFVNVKRIEDVDRAVNTKLHLGRKIEAKRAIPKKDMDNSSRKLFVGGIPISLTNTEFRQYFETFGAVSDAQIMTERQSGHSRGFGFVTFEDDPVARNVIKNHHVIQGKTVEVKKAQPKKSERPPVHVLHPYPVPIFPSYPIGYAPSIFGQHLYHHQPMAYDPYYMGHPGGVIYAPQYFETAYETPVGYTTRGSMSRGSTSDSRKGSGAVSPGVPNQKSNRYGSRTSSSSSSRTSLSSNVSPTNWTFGAQRSYTHLLPQARTERSWSAAPPSTSSVVLRQRRMSLPPAPPGMRTISVTPTRNESASASKTQHTSSLHKYFE